MLEKAIQNTGRTKKALELKLLQKELNLVVEKTAVFLSNSWCQSWCQQLMSKATPKKPLAWHVVCIQL